MITSPHHFEAFVGDQTTARIICSKKNADKAQYIESETKRKKSPKFWYNHLGLDQFAR